MFKILILSLIIIGNIEQKSYKEPKKLLQLLRLIHEKGFPFNFVHPISCNIKNNKMILTNIVSSPLCYSIITYNHTLRYGERGYKLTRMLLEEFGCDPNLTYTNNTPKVEDNNKYEYEEYVSSSLGDPFKLAVAFTRINIVKMMVKYGYDFKTVHPIDLIFTDTKLISLVVTVDGEPYECTEYHTIISEVFEEFANTEKYGQYQTESNVLLDNLMNNICSSLSIGRILPIYNRLMNVNGI